MKNHPLKSKERTTQVALEKGLNNWLDLTQTIAQIPYGRNANRTDVHLVLIENKGTCSSKHALLKKIANENNIPNVQLIMGIYLMNAENTPKIKSVLEKYQIHGIPEAHCYLKIDGAHYDFTSPTADYESYKAEILLEKPIEWDQVAEFKPRFHQEFVRKWMIENQANKSFEEVWAIREECIQNMSVSLP